MGLKIKKIYTCTTEKSSCTTKKWREGGFLFQGQVFLMITLRCLCNECPLTPHFYILTLGKKVVYSFSMFGYSLESTWGGSSSTCPQSGLS